MVAVRPLSGHLKREIDLGGRQFGNGRRVVLFPFLRCWFGRHFRQDFLSGSAGAGAGASSGSAAPFLAVVAFGSSGGRPVSIFSLISSRLTSSPSEISARFHWKTASSLRPTRQ